jgi:hypothetical protein
MVLHRPIETTRVSGQVRLTPEGERRGLIEL